MIQEGINQLLSLAGAAVRLSPALTANYARRIETKEALGKAKAAESALKDISTNLNNPDKQYTLTELKDIESRVGEHNRNIYNAKTMAIPGSETAKYLSNNKIKKNLLPQEEYSNYIKSIEQGLSDKRQTAMKEMQEKAFSRIEQKNDFKKLKGIFREE